MTTKLLIDFAIAVVGFVVYVNVGWIFDYYLLNTRKAGIFENFLAGPEWLTTKEEKEAQFNEGKKLTGISLLFVFFWPILLVLLLVIWLIQLIIWFGKAMLWLGKRMLWIGKMIIGGGIAKKIVGEK